MERWKDLFYCASAQQNREVFFIDIEDNFSQQRWNPEDDDETMRQSLYVCQKTIRKEDLHLNCKASIK